jgi:hypothetical protein
MFEKQEYADQFINGRLYLHRLSYFQQLEQANTDGRPDENEAVAVWLQKASIEFKAHPELNIMPENLAKPISISFDHHSNLHVFCMTAMHTGNFECVNGLIAYTEDDADKLKKQLELHEDCLSFGQFAVVVNAREFFLRAKAAIESKGSVFSAGLVDYFDPETFEGRFAWSKIPFTKAQTFSYQKEYRITVDTKTNGIDPITIEIGDICDCAVKMRTAEINTSFKLEPRAERL